MVSATNSVGNLPPIVIDTREQLPFSFGCKTIAQTLQSGDYSLAGYENRIAIERKSVGDLLGCMTAGRERFVRELTRLQTYEFSAVVVEGDLPNLVAGDRSRMNPLSVVATVLAWQQRFVRTHWVFCPNRAWAERLTFLMLERFHRDTIDGKRQLGRAD